MPATYRLPDGSQLLVSVTYTAGEKRGVIVLVLISFLSLFSVLGLLFAIAISAFNTRKSCNNQLFVRSHLVAYFVCLLLSNFIQAIASIMSTTWIHNAGIMIGSACTFQGVMTQIADVGIALWTMAISVHTFCHFFLGLNPTRPVLWGVLICGWTMNFALVLLGPAMANMEKSGPFFSISGSSCWISSHYRAGQVILDRLIMLLVALLGFILSSLVHFRAQRWFACVRRPTSPEYSNEDDAIDSKNRQSEAIQSMRKMLLYPIAYIAVVLPLMTAQFASWTGTKVSFGVNTFCMAIFLLSGFVNVLLFIAIRPILPPKSWRIGRQSASLDQASNHPESIPHVNGHKRTSSGSSTETVVNASRKTKLRPPDIIITRDSIDSMYSIYDEEAPSEPVAHSRPAPRSAPARTY